MTGERCRRQVSGISNKWHACLRSYTKECTKMKEEKRRTGKASKAANKTGNAGKTQPKDLAWTEAGREAGRKAGHQIKNTVARHRLRQATGHVIRQVARSRTPKLGIDFWGSSRGRSTDQEHRS